MKHTAFIFALLILTPLAFAAERRPNIVLIYADDLGYGDVGCYGSTAILTPNIDRIAREGLRFTDGHSTSATCTPSRYALLTGIYPWRKKGTGILPGDAAMIIEPGSPTLPVLMKGAGYTTAIVGKWHLGLGSPGKEIDWNGEIKPSPLDIGFDHLFMMAATGDRVPCVYLEDRKVVGLDPADPIKVSYKEKVGIDPTGEENPELLKMKLTQGHEKTIINGISRIGWMSGGNKARWIDEDMGDTFTNRAIQFIERTQHEGESKKPFFLFYASHEPHVPRVPHPRFVGKTKLGPRGDAIAQLDHSVGEILNTLDRLKLTDNTLVIFTSDNGPVLDDGYADDAKEKLGDHKPAGPLRGGKYHPYEAGTRVPFIVRYPGTVKPGTTSDALMCQIDFAMSFAALTNNKIFDNLFPDSEDHLKALLGESPKGREMLIEQAKRMAVRKGNWKFIAPGKPDGPGELYDLATDLAETKNLAAERPEIAKELAQELAAVMGK